MTQATGYVRHFVACNQHDLKRCLPLFIDGRRYGYVLKDLALLLLAQKGLFVDEGTHIALSPHFETFAARSEALLDATDILAKERHKPLRNELYAVIENWGDTPIAQIDRVAVPWFGVRAWGVHVNGFVRQADGIHLWVGERAANRPAEPGKLDNMIGGGQPFGLSLEENLCKEAQEEAGIDASLAKTSDLIRTLDYRLERSEGMRSDTLFIYDLELPANFRPRNTDGEVAAFHLMPLTQVADLIKNTDQFKFNCNLVIIDFLMRHGFITAEDREYAELSGWLAS